MTYLLVKDGVVVNVIKVDDASVLEHPFYEQFDSIEKGADFPWVGLGYTKDGDTFISPDAAQELDVYKPKA